MDSYCVATPIGLGRDWTLGAYRRGIESLRPPPAAVGVTASTDIFRTFFSQNPLYVHVETEADQELPLLKRIARNRRVLQKWFTEERTETWLWWLDSDIEVFKDTAKDMFEYLEMKKALLLANGCQGRRSKRNWHGSGCLMVHRDVVNFGRFIVGEAIGDDGKLHRICEDAQYLSIFRYVGQDILRRIKPSFRSAFEQANVTKVVHHLPEGHQHPDYEYKEDNWRGSQRGDD